MELPDDVVALIREYSRPRTRPNWRQSKPILSTYKLYLIAQYKFDNSWQVAHYDALLDTIKTTDWYWSYRNIQDFGLDIYFRRHYYYYGVDTTIEQLNQIDGLSAAIRNHEHMYGSMYVFR